MTDCRFRNFDIAVQGSAVPYAVRALYGDRSAEGQLDLPAADLQWLGPAYASASSLVAPAMLPSGRPQLETLGSRLFHLLWRDQVRELWLRGLADVEAGACDGLRVRLSLSPADAAALPWELSFDPDRRTFLAASPQTPLVRVVNLLRYVGQARPLAARLPLTVLAAIPEDPTGQYDAQAEAEALEAALWPLMPAGIRLVYLGGQISAADLRRSLESERPAVLHLVTHGRGDGVVLWQDGQPVLTPAAVLKVALESAPSLRLALLSACSTGQVVEPSPLGSLGAQLLQSGAPAVIAMQFDLRTTTAAHFAEQFYTYLLAGRCSGAVDAAANYARSSLFVRDPDALDFATPVAWLNAPDGAILATPPIALRKRPAPAPALGGAEIDALLAEVRALRTWLDEEPVFDRAELSAAARPIDAGRQERLQSARDLLARIEHAQEPHSQAELARRYLPELRTHRERVQRLTAILRANLRPTPPSS